MYNSHLLGFSWVFVVCGTKANDLVVTWVVVLGFFGWSRHYRLPPPCYPQNLIFWKCLNFLQFFINVYHSIYQTIYHFLWSKSITESNYHSIIYMSTVYQPISTSYLSTYAYLPMSIYLCLPASTYLSLPTYVYLHLPLSTYLSLSTYIYLPTYINIHSYLCLHTIINLPLLRTSAYLPTYVYLPTYTILCQPINI